MTRCSKNDQSGVWNKTGPIWKEVIDEVGKNRRKMEKNYWGYVYIAPALLFVFAVMLIPLVYTLIMGVVKTDLFTGKTEFVGMKQFIRIFGDQYFRLAVKNTFLWTVGSVVFQFLIGFIIANILNASQIRGKTIIRILLMVPWVLPSVVSAMVWDWSYHPDYGIINEILKRAGIITQSINWTSSGSTALISAIIVNVWKMVPFVALMTEAALQGVSQDLKEAARVDGAKSYQVFFHIVIPEISSSINTVILLLSIWTMNSFTFIYLLTEGGPAHSSEILSLYIYRQAFKNYDFGAASAAASVLFVITASIALLYNRFVIRRDREC